MSSPDTDTILTEQEVAPGEPLLEMENLTKHFSATSGLLGGFGLERDGYKLSITRQSDPVRAVDNVSFTVPKGQTVGLVGESGCGKSTLARTVLRLIEPTDGNIIYKGTDITELSGEELRSIRKDVQIIFQDPQSSLDPRMKVGPIVEEPMKAHSMPSRSKEVSRPLDVTADGIDVTTVVYEDADMLLNDDRAGIVVERLEERPEDEESYAAVAEAGDGFIVATTRANLDLTLDADDDHATLEVHAGVSVSEVREEHVRELLEKVGLDPQHYNRYPHEFSGGQRQRVNLARALSVDPEFIVCDEPTSALDVSIQAQVLNTMKELQAELGLTYLFISHDLSVIRHISDRVAVMYLGQLAEVAGKEELFENPQHPYTQALLSSIPNPDPRSSEGRGVLRGDVPSPIDPPSGCRFRTRCPDLIAPTDLDLADDEWDRVRTFVRAVDRRTFDDTDTDAIRSQFFNGSFPTGEAGEAVSSAIDHLHEEQWEEAVALLKETFTEPSICATEIPAYEVEPKYGDDRHFAACHLNASPEENG